MPSAATVRRTLRLMNVSQLEQVLGDWIAARLGAEQPEHADRTERPRRTLALDSKAVRAAQMHGTNAHLVSVVTHTAALTLAQCAVVAKSNEIRAVQGLHSGRSLRGWVVTLDAMHTQRKTATLILRQGGHYLMVVKQNQPTLYATLAKWFACPTIPGSRRVHA